MWPEPGTCCRSVGKKDVEYYEKVLQYSLLDALKALMKGNKDDFKYEMDIVVLSTLI